MNTPTLTARLLCAAAAAVVTLLLFSSVVSLAEPDRSTLMAKVQHLEKPASAPVTLASNVNANAGR